MLLRIVIPFTSIGLVEQNKRFLHLTAGASGGVHNARLLRRSSLLQQLYRVEKIPNKTISLGDDIREIPLLTIGDSAFPCLEWLIKGFNEQTSDPGERLFNKKLFSARVVTENACGMSKVRWRIILKNARLGCTAWHIMATIVFHNTYIHFDDPCEPRWNLTVEELDLIQNNDIPRFESRHSKSNSIEFSKKIGDWLWEL